MTVFSVLSSAARLVALQGATKISDGCAAAARGVRSAHGPMTLPGRVWSPGTSLHDGTDHSLVDRVLPLPASAAVSRALTGRRRPSLDAWSPLGARCEDAPPVLLLPVDAEAPGQWTPEDAADLIRDRGCGTPVVPVHTVLLTPDLRVRPLLRLLRRVGVRRMRGVLVVPTPSPGGCGSTGHGRWRDALSVADAVVVPDPPAFPPELRLLAAAAGRPVLALEAIPPSWSEATDAGRSARLDLVRRTEPSGTPPQWPPVAGPTLDAVRERRRVVVAGHDLKFAGPLIEDLRGRGHEVRVDPWKGHARHDVELSRSLAAWADTVHCEWSLGNGAWYSRNLPEASRLTIRTHLQEAGTEFPGRTRAEAVDAWVFVAEHVRAQVVRDARVDLRRTCWIPNAVRLTPAADIRPQAQHADRRFTIGMVGVIPERKGLHRALDVLSALRAEDPRFRLRIRGHRPHEVEWMSARATRGGYYSAQELRISSDPALARAVAWDAFGPDMDAWYARVGVVLSASDFESFHFTLPDGAMNNCLPRSFAWAGADRLYPSRWLGATTEDLVRSIARAVADPHEWAQQVEEAKSFVVARYGADVAATALAQTVLGER